MGTFSPIWVTPGGSTLRAMRTPRWTIAATLAGTALLALAPAAPAAKPKPKKPSLKIAGLSVNQVFMKPGTKVTYPGDSQNRCYRMGGPSGEPQSLTVYGFVTAVKIPKNAPTTVTYTTPWTARFGGDLATMTGEFSKVLFHSKGRQQAAIFGGAQGPYDFYSYNMLPSGIPTSYYLSGDYTLDVTTKVNGKTLHAKGAVKVLCLALAAERAVEPRRLALDAGDQLTDLRQAGAQLRVPDLDRRERVLQVGEHLVGVVDGLDGRLDEAGDTGRRRALDGLLERPARQAVALGERRVGALGAPVGLLHRAEQVLLEQVGVALVELLVGGAEGRERDRELIDRVSDRVEQCLAGLSDVVRHHRQRSRRPGPRPDGDPVRMRSWRPATSSTSRPSTRATAAARCCATSRSASPRATGSASSAATATASRRCCS